MRLDVVESEIQNEAIRKNCEVPPEALQKIQALYDAGLMLQAWRVAEEHGPLKLWTGQARTLGWRLAGNLGGYKVAAVLHWKAYQENKTDCDCVSYYAHDLLHRRGPLKAWEFLERFGKPALPQTREGELHFFTIRAMVAADLRDFSAAEHF